jgi:hypothetical protein
MTKEAEDLGYAAWEERVDAIYEEIKSVGANLLDKDFIKLVSAKERAKEKCSCGNATPGLSMKCK